MIWFITMVAGLLGIYSKGHSLVNRPRLEDPVITALGGVKDSIKELAESVSGIDRRVTALERKGEQNGR